MVWLKYWETGPHPFAVAEFHAELDVVVGIEIDLDGSVIGIAGITGFETTLSLGAGLAVFAKVITLKSEILIAEEDEEIGKADDLIGVDVVVPRIGPKEVEADGVGEEVEDTGEPDALVCEDVFVPLAGLEEIEIAGTAGVKVVDVVEDEELTTGEEDEDAGAADAVFDVPDDEEEDEDEDEDGDEEDKQVVDEDGEDAIVFEMVDEGFVPFEDDDSEGEGGA